MAGYISALWSGSREMAGNCLSKHFMLGMYLEVTAWLTSNKHANSLLIGFRRESADSSDIDLNSSSEYKHDLNIHVRPHWFYLYCGYRCVA